MIWLLSWRSFWVADLDLGVALDLLLIINTVTYSLMRPPSPENTGAQRTNFFSQVTKIYSCSRIIDLCIYWSGTSLFV